MPEFISNIIDPQKIIEIFGLIGIIVIIFAESGLFFGFFFPGDSLLFTAGFFASQGFISLPILLVGTFVASVVGDSVGYWFGKKTGRTIFSKEDSILFKKEYAERAERFYETHGKKTIILARFMPIIRTFAPIVAGIGNMKYKTFLSYNIIGGFVWTFGVSFLGYLLGKSVPNADKYLLPIIIFIIALSFAPGIIHVIKNKKNNSSQKQEIK